MEARTAVASRQSAFMGAGVRPARRTGAAPKRAAVQVTAGMKDIRDRIDSVANTKKITEAMKLVAAAKVRRAQEAVISGRPFAENLVKAMYGVNQRLRLEDVDSPLCVIRPVKSVLLVIITGDRGLCGGYNNFALKKLEERYAELTSLGLNVRIVGIGRKGLQYMKRRPKFNIVKEFTLGQTPTTKEAQAIADELFSEFVAAEVDKVELIYTKFVSLIASNPVIQTLLPLTPLGEICDVDGKCVDAREDEIFRLTTSGGQFAVSREKSVIETPPFDESLIFEQDPAQILDALLPLYLNSCLLRSLQEALASELAARMNAMNNASDNAKELQRVLTIAYNKQRQAKITTELSEIVSGANA